MSSGEDLARRIKALALAVGFDLVGIADPNPGPDTRFLGEWLRRGYAGEMDYLGARAPERIDPRRLLPGVRSVIAVGLVYEPGADVSPAVEGVPAGAGRVARYAGGEDYHAVLNDRLRALQSAIEAFLERPLQSRRYVDTGPVLERVFAARAGLGWVGRNTCIIHPRLGSYLFLGVLLSDLELPMDTPEADHCGTCRACLDACPTDAFPEPYVLDATRCISYTTIEARGPIPEPLRAAQGEHVFGCDICQDVCPWNANDKARRSRGEVGDPLGLRARLEVHPEWRAPALEWVLGLDEPAWRRVTAHTALRRAKHRGLLRNALVAAGNAGEARLRPHVERHARGEDPLLAEHARWALARLPGS